MHNIRYGGNFLGKRLAANNRRLSFGVNVSKEINAHTDIRCGRFVFMARLKPIRIGDTFRREYKFWEPIEGSDDPDYDNPSDLSGITFTFNIWNNGVLRTFTTANGVSVVDNIVTIELEKEQTAEFKRDPDAESFLGRTYSGGNQDSTAHRKERILRRSEVTT